MSVRALTGTVKFLKNDYYLVFMCKYIFFQVWNPTWQKLSVLLDSGQQRNILCGQALSSRVDSESSAKPGGEGGGRGGEHTALSSRVDPQSSAKPKPKRVSVAGLRAPLPEILCVGCISGHV